MNIQTTTSPKIINRPSVAQPKSQPETQTQSPEDGYTPSTPSGSSFDGRTAITLGAGAAGAALGLYAGIATGTAPGIVGAAVGGVAAGATGAVVGFFPDLSNSINGKPTNYTLLLGGLGLVGGGIAGAALGSQVSSALVGIAGGAVAGLGTAFVAGVVAKETL